MGVWVTGWLKNRVEKAKIMDDGDMINGLLVDTHCIAIIYSAPPLTALTQRAMNACNVIFCCTPHPLPQKGPVSRQI